MNQLYARTVFFVSNAERSLRFFTKQLGFKEDWVFKEGERVYVCQVSLFGFELILNRTDSRTASRAGHGRVFIGLEDEQGESLREHFANRAIKTERVEWGRPTLLVRDPDNNEIFFWVPGDDVTNYGISTSE